MTTNPDLRTYTDESLLAAVARHARTRGPSVDLAYRMVLVAELKRRDVGSATDLFTKQKEADS